MGATSVTHSCDLPPSSHAVLPLQNQDVLSNLESASVRIVKPLQPPSSSGGRTVPFIHQQQPQPQSQVRATLATNTSTPAPDLNSGPTPDSAGGLRMATIQEDTSSGSHLGEEGLLEDFTTAGACSSATKSSFEDLTEQNLPAKDRRRLKRQERIDTKETECWERKNKKQVRLHKRPDICFVFFREHEQMCSIICFSFLLQPVLKRNISFSDLSALKVFIQSHEIRLSHWTNTTQEVSKPSNTKSK